MSESNDIQQNNEQLLNDIQSLQKMEQQLFDSLETNPNLTTKQQEQIIEKMNLSNETYQQLLFSIKSKLFQLQESRVRPGLDFKIILSWNGLMLKGLSDAAFYLQNNHFKALAIELEAFIWKHFYNSKNNELFRISSKDSIYGTGFLEDYACTIDAFIKLYKSRDFE